MSRSAFEWEQQLQGFVLSRGFITWFTLTEAGEKLSNPYRSKKEESKEDLWMICDGKPKIKIGMMQPKSSR